MCLPQAPPAETGQYLEDPAVGDTFTVEQMRTVSADRGPETLVAVLNLRTKFLVTTAALAT